MAKDNPLISCIMPVFNAEKFLVGSIESILAQTLGNFEFIIINDGSTDQSAEIIQSYCQRDPRIILIENIKNLGLKKTRNLGIEKARGDYIALMDSDDISFSERFEKQVKYLQVYQNISVLGTSFIGIDEYGNQKGLQTFPSSPGLVRWGLFFGTSIANPTVMMKSNIFTVHKFRYQVEQSEDYNLWVRLSADFNMANLETPLLYYRLHPDNTSKRFKAFQRAVSFSNQELLINKYINHHLNEEILLGLRHSDQISSMRIAIQVLIVLIKLYHVTIQWQLTDEEKKKIAQLAARKMRSIWYYQKYNLLLAPIMVYSWYLMVRNQ
ncbi:MAG: glycosyltransferase family 2 protein [Anaerolineaceae bacterium]|nr:glycosyltransferase family 2 protein [Anaerolineaceae bacterium]